MRSIGRHLLPAVLLTGLAATHASAAVLVLQDDNTVARLDDASQSGLYDFEVDGLDYLTQYGFWYRVGNTAEQHVSTLTKIGSAATDTNGDGFADTALVYYRDAADTFRFELSYQISGGSPGSGSAGLAQQFRLDNRTNGNLSIALFEFVDVQVGGTAAGDIVEVVTPNFGTASDGPYLWQEGITPPLTRTQVGDPATLLGLLNDGVATTLNNTTGPIGPGDNAYALQWNLTLGRNQSVTFSKAITVIPEPASLVLVLGAALLGLTRRFG